METRIYTKNNQDIAACAKIVKEGGLIAFPTETVYGLGANALLPDSVRNIYAAKGRPSDNPLIVHVADKAQISLIAAHIPDKAQAVIDEFMPGPVTVVLPKKQIVPDVVTGGLNTVAVRMPANEIALRFISEAGCPVCAPSANTSGKPSPTCARHVYDDLNGKIPGIIDGGDCEVGVESTVIDFTTDTPRLLRAGGMELERLEKVIGKVEVVKNSKVALCPGMKYKHYSPTAEVFVVPVGEGMAERITAAYDELSKLAKPVVIAMQGTANALSGVDCWSVGDDLSGYAHNLFSFLRRADELSYTHIICEGVPEEGMGASVANRLEKASGGKTL